jgi:hypothetical protein
MQVRSRQHACSDLTLGGPWHAVDSGLLTFRDANSGKFRRTYAHVCRFAV